MDALQRVDETPEGHPLVDVAGRTLGDARVDRRRVVAGGDVVTTRAGVRAM